MVMWIGCFTIVVALSTASAFVSHQDHYFPQRLEFQLVPAAQSLLWASTNHNHDEEPSFDPKIHAAEQLPPILIVANDPSSAEAAAAGASLALAWLQQQQQQHQHSPNDGRNVVQTLTTTTTTKESKNNRLTRMDLDQALETVRKQRNTNTQHYSPSTPPNTEVIVHAVLDGTSGLFLEEHHQNTDQGISFLGVHVPPTGVGPNQNLERDQATILGNTVLQPIVDNHQSSRSADPPHSMAISMDWPTHLSLLQANALPKSLSPSFPAAHNGDSFLILPNQNNDALFDTMVLVDYLYDFSRLGGTDPLGCQTREQCFSVATTSAANNNASDDPKRAQLAMAAAYTVVCGAMMTMPMSLPPDNAKIAAARLAYAVGMMTPPAMSPTSAVGSVNRLHQQGQQLHQREEPTIRRTYLDYGYR